MRLDTNLECWVDFNVWLHEICPEFAQINGGQLSLFSTVSQHRNRRKTFWCTAEVENGQWQSETRTNIVHLKFETKNKGTLNWPYSGIRLYSVLFHNSNSVSTSAAIKRFFRLRIGIMAHDITLMQRFSVRKYYFCNIAIATWRRHFGVCWGISQLKKSLRERRKMS